MSDEFNFPTTGDAVEDRKIADSFVLHCQRMAKNICPNGCAEMIWDDPHNRHCGICGFGGFSTRPFDMDGGNS